MKNKRVLIDYFIFVIFMFAFVACASTSKQESAGEYIDDSVITAKIKSLLAVEDSLKYFQISVETNQGVVQLSGFVDSQTGIDKAGAIAISVKGVKSVSNEMICPLTGLKP